MKSTLLTILRDKESSIEQFRWASDQLGLILAYAASTGFMKENISVTTPIEATPGEVFNRPVVLVPILRAGLALLYPFLKVFPKASIGMVGAERNEKTAIASCYYCKLPPLSPDAEIVLLDPMLATGGSAKLTIEKILEAGAKQEQITAVFVISAPEGIEVIKKNFPHVRLVIAQEDEKLNSHKYIVPGLGDYGDRYFGT